jgi:multidrug resistance efflux pump
MTSLGRGNISRVSPTAVTGSGYIVSCAVQAGDKVTRGQLLFETVTGDFGSPEEVSTEIRAGTDGVISSLNISAGGSLEKAGVIAEIYPKNAVQVTAEVSETDLKELSVGQKVKVELDWNQDQGISYEGTITDISSLGTVGEENTTYPVYVSFQPDEYTRYNMSAEVSTLDENAAALQAGE